MKILTSAIRKIHFRKRCFASLTFAALSLAFAPGLQATTDDENDDEEFVGIHSDEQARHSQLSTRPADYSTRTRDLFRDYNRSENAAVRRQIRSEASAGSNARARVTLMSIGSSFRESRNSRRANLNSALRARVGERVRAPRVFAMSYPDGNACETVSLRYKFKKRKVWVYPALASDVGPTEAARQANVACACAQQQQNLPCYNGSEKIATGAVVLVKD